MKISAVNFQTVAYAQIEPENVILKIFRQLLKSISLLIILSGVFFLSTSYIGRKKATEFLNLDYYSGEIHSGLVGYFKVYQPIAENKHKKLSLDQMVSEFYQATAFRPAWTINNSVTPGAVNIMYLFRKAEYYGLNSKQYHPDELGFLHNKIEQSVNKDELIEYRQEFELLFTRSCLLFMINLNAGIVNQDSISPSLRSLLYYLSDIAGTSDADEGILAIQPKNASYRNLQKALERFLSIDRVEMESYNVPSPSVNPDISYKRTGQILSSLGYIDPGHEKADTVFTNALMQFQVHHGLIPDGELNRNTREALSMSASERYSKIALNLDRMRKELPSEKNYVFVNIPAYKLRVIKNNGIKESFNVVVGKPVTPTPVLSSKIEYIVANPQWNVPRSITVNEILPRVRKDSSYLIRNNFKIIDKKLNEVGIDEVNWQETDAESFDYYFVQNSGNSNALGTIKFSFKNPYHVYIHDTPSKRYFAHNIRAYSHGCIRLEDPKKLADYLIENNLSGEDKPNINTILNKKEEKEIELSEPLDIYIRYLTVEADENLNIFFYKDIYGKDIQLSEYSLN